VKTYEIILTGDDDVVIRVDMIDAEARAVRRVVDMLTDERERSGEKYQPGIAMTELS
jgi:hypothetical protein